MDKLAFQTLKRSFAARLIPKTIILLLAVGLVSFRTYSQTTDTIKGMQVVGTNKLPFILLHIKSEKGKDKKAPVILFLHGAGERGNDNQKQLQAGVPALVKSIKENKTRSCILLLPQCPENEKWVNTDWTLSSHTMEKNMSWPLQGAISILDSVLKADKEADSSRVFLTGLSMGGFGTWELLQRFPEKFAAAIPICGGGDTARAAVIKTVPVWAFHGKKDKLVKVSRTTEMVAAIRKHDPVVRMTIFENEGHLCWNKVYENKEVINWLFSNKLHAE